MENGVSVVVTSHNYGRFLGKCLRSINQQTVYPRETIVVDDASTDNTKSVSGKFPVAYHRVNFKSMQKARARGHQVSNPSYPYILFVDADDFLETNYLAQMISSAVNNKSDVVYPNIHRFGMIDLIQDSPDQFDPRALSNRNYIVTSSLMKKSSFEKAGGFDSSVPHWADWDLWLRLSESGARFNKADTVFHYRMHKNQQSQWWKENIAGQVMTKMNLMSKYSEVTLFTPFSGKEYCLRKYLDSIKSLDYPKDKIRLFFYDNSCSDNFSKRLTDFLHLHRKQYASIHYMQDDRKPVQHGDDARATRTSEIYSVMSETLRTKYCFVVEDDVLVHPNTLNRMLFDLCVSKDDVAAVGAAVVCRHTKKIMAYKLSACLNGAGRIVVMPIRLQEKPNGIEDAVTSFSCMLIDAWKLPKLVVQPMIGGFPASDWAFCSWVQSTGMRSVVDWGIRPKHFIDKDHFAISARDFPMENTMAFLGPYSGDLGGGF